MIGLLLLAAAAVADPLAGAQVPHGVAANPHIQVARYDPAGVVGLTGHLGFQTTIQFEDGERIENVAIGDAAAWQITPSKRADSLFLKPLAHARMTNMTVITDRRTYNFMLSVAAPKASVARAPWLLRFAVPAPPVAVRASAPVPAPIGPEGRNVHYTTTGSAGIMPTRVFDDGAKTYFAWAPEAPIPAIFAVNPDGSESVVDATMREGFSVVEQTAGRFVLRLGDSKATVESTPGVERRVATKEARAHD